MSNSVPDVYIQTDALEKLKAYYKYAEHKEICGLGKVYIEQGQLVVEDVILLEQEVSGSEANFDRDAIAKWHYELIQEGLDPSEYRLCWHKHPITGWSTTDDKCIEDMNNGEWMLNLVKQSNGQFLFRLDLYAPFRITMDNLTWYELRDTDEALDQQCKEEVKAKVKQKTYAVPASSGGYVYSSDGKSGWSMKKEEKKNESPNGNQGQLGLPSETNAGSDGDKFFESLADTDWESYYSWSDKQKIYQRWSE